MGNVQATKDMVILAIVGGCEKLQRPQPSYLKLRLMTVRQLRTLWRTMARQVGGEIDEAIKEETQHLNEPGPVYFHEPAAPNGGAR